MVMRGTVKVRELSIEDVSNLILKEFDYLQKEHSTFHCTTTKKNGNIVFQLQNTLTKPGKEPDTFVFQEFRFQGRGKDQDKLYTTVISKGNTLSECIKENAGPLFVLETDINKIKERMEENYNTGFNTKEEYDRMIQFLNIQRMRNINKTEDNTETIALFRNR
ncbi:hypothetical protein [Bacillus paranthracis]|uniref:hypothetical protein n=1 Tax=Bacillus paranthracis TaxID=2026186 RepID=UPI001583E3B4|nr:hypothetical protein [Bacillus paranthracis]NUJ08488.1 hypothetical protein [Bacillus paranthracis]